MAYTLEDLDRGDLFELCDKYGTDYKRTMGKDTLIKLLRADGITDNDIDKVEPIEEVEVAQAPQGSDVPAVVEETVEPEETVLVRMTRKNPRFEVDGVKFERAHPFQILPYSVANHLIENVGGFRVASPHEAEEFYK